MEGTAQIISEDNIKQTKSTKSSSLKRKIKLMKQ